MLNDTFWFAMGVAATLVTAYVANRTGRIQISFMRKEHELNLLKAMTRVGSNVALELRTPNPSRPDVRRFFLATAIYNEGELPAEQLNGNWVLSCSDSLHNCNIPLQWEFLGATPYQLQAHEIGGLTITQKLLSGEATLQVDIEFSYLVRGQDAPNSYRASYKYDSDSKQMKRIPQR